MFIPTYQPNIPTGTVNLDQDYLNLQGNFQQLNIAYGLDHVAFSDTSGLPPTVNGISGLHKVIHMLSFSTLATNPLNNNYPISLVTVPPSQPLKVDLTGEIFTTESNDGYNPDQILWYQSGGARLTQLTRNFQPLPFKNNYTAASGGAVGTDFNAGATFIPGALTYQYGSFTPGTISGSSGTIKFPLKFINASTVIVSLTAICKAGGTTVNSTFSIETGTVTATQFKWSCPTSTSAYAGFTWTAVGN